jgi:hypothetical protein
MLHPRFSLASASDSVHDCLSSGVTRDLCPFPASRFRLRARSSRTSNITETMMRKSGIRAPVRTLSRVLKFALAFLVDIVVADGETGNSTGTDDTRQVAGDI